MATKYRRITRAVTHAPWAIMPEKMSAICELLSLRRSGKKLSRQEVSARIGSQRQPMRSTAPSVAVLNVFGTLAQHGGMMTESSGGTSHDAISRVFDAAMSDPNVSSIVLNIDSPGGTVAGTPELAAKIFSARGKKQVIAVANSLAASAAYWIGSAAQKFVVTPSGMGGSIGVLYVHTDDTAAAEKIGIKETVISAGKYKSEGYGPLSEEAKTAIQKRVDATYGDFVAAVAKHRGVSTMRVEADFGQGRVLGARDAVAAGMFDSVATLEDVLNELGVGLVGENVRTDAPAFSMEGLSMNPELFGALVRVGMCPITASQAEAENALARFFAASGKAKPADEAAQLAELSAYIANPHQVAAGGANVTATPPVKHNAAVIVSGNRAGEIFAAVRLANLGDCAMDFAQELINDANISLADAFKKIEAKAQEVRKPTGAAVSGGAAEQDKFRAEARSAVLSRCFSGSAPAKVYNSISGDYVDFKPAGRSSQALQSLPRLAEECLIRDGFEANAVRNLTPAHIAQIALGVKSPSSVGLRADGGGPYNTSGTFSNLLMDAANVMLRRSYDETPTTFQAWMKRAEDIRDFKTINRVIAGEIGDPRVVPEGGEFEEATMTDGKESYALRVWGQIFHISWQAVVNDQLSAFTEIPRKQGVAMRRKQNKLAYGVLNDNGTMADTGALFNSTAVSSAGGHANLTTGAGAPTVANISSLAGKMAKQKGLDPAVSSVLNLTPRFILAGATLGYTIQELLGSTSYVVANGNSGVKNIWYNAMTPVIDEELGAAGSGTDTQWFLAASSDQVDTVEYAYLSGYDSPALDSEPSFDRLAMKYRIFQPFAVKAIDFRGLQKHAGA